MRQVVRDVIAGPFSDEPGEPGGSNVPLIQKPIVPPRPWPGDGVINPAPAPASSSFPWWLVILVLAAGSRRRR